MDAVGAGLTWQSSRASHPCTYAPRAELRPLLTRLHTRPLLTRLHTSSSTHNTGSRGFMSAVLVLCTSMLAGPRLTANAVLVSKRVHAAVHRGAEGAEGAEGVES